MKQIRLLRLPHIVRKIDDAVPEFMQWTPDTPAERQELDRLVDVGNRMYGPGSHWIEERDSQEG